MPSVEAFFFFSSGCDCAAMVRWVPQEKRSLTETTLRWGSVPSTPPSPVHARHAPSSFIVRVPTPMTWWRAFSFLPSLSLIASFQLLPPHMHFSLLCSSIYQSEGGGGSQRWFLSVFFRGLDAMAEGIHPWAQNWSLFPLVSVTPSLPRSSFRPCTLTTTPWQLHSTWSKENRGGQWHRDEPRGYSEQRSPVIVSFVYCRCPETTTVSAIERRVRCPPRSPDWTFYSPPSRGEG